MAALDRVQDALLRAGSVQKGRDWTCPSHKDGTEKDPSLSVNEGANGVIMKCHAGCDNEDVLRAIGLKMADLFDTPPPGKAERKRIVSEYDYTDETGKLLFQVVRYEPKDFRQRVPTGDGTWKWSIAGVRRVPFHLPQLIQAIADGKTVYICEGEKDVGAVESVGGVATCNPGGAGKWRDEFAPYFTGATVVIVADNDAAGRKHAVQVSESLVTVTHALTIVNPKEGKDAYDHVKRYGYALDEFVVDFGVYDDLVPEPATPGRVNPLRSRLLDIDEIDDIPPPTYIIEDLVVSDALTVLFGMPGHGKSFIALDWALSIAHAREEWLGKKVMSGGVLYVVAEGLSGVGMRKKAWRKKRKVHTKGELKWLRDPVNLLDPEAVADLIDICDELQPILVVVDTLARSMPGADENAPAPMSEAIESLDAIRRATRAAVVAVHHTPKDGSSPRGHSSLLGAVQTSIKVAMDEGVISMSVEKQKDGVPITMNLRLEGIDDSAVLDVSGSAPRTMGDFNELGIVNTLRNNAPEGGALATSLILSLSGIPKPTFYRHLKTLIEAGRVIETGRGRISLKY